MNALLVGLGNQGKRILDRLCARGDHVEVAAVNSHAKWDRYLSYLSDPFWHSVFICSPDDTHERYARAAYHNSKDVYVEKPVGDRFDETRRILRYAKDAGKVFSAGYTFLWHPVFPELLDNTLDNWHFRWTKPTKSRTMDRTLMSHHLSMAIQAFGRPMYSNIIQADDRCLGQFIFEGGKTVTSNIRLGKTVIHEAEVRQETGHCIYDMKWFGDPDPIEQSLDHFDRLRAGTRRTFKQDNWKFDMEHLTYEVAKVLDGK